jgi:HlyD family secretion protein
VEAVTVKSGLQDHMHIEITEGITIEDQVITGPYSAISRTLNNGDKVEPESE